MEDEVKITIDLLYKEFQRIQAKSVMTDDWFFRFLSIAVVPFLAFVAYVLANTEYRIFLAALPLLSVIGATVVLMLSTHYFYVDLYGQYLQKRINALLGGTVLCDDEFGAVAYKGWSPVLISHFVGFTALVAFNIAAVPVINVARHRFADTHPHLPSTAAFVLEGYWCFIWIFIVLFLTMTGLSIARLRVGSKRLKTRLF